MTDRIGGARRKTRNLFKKHAREKGKISLTRYLAEYKKGDLVVLKSEPGVQDGMYHPRFHGRTGVVLSKRGECYFVGVNDMDKAKKVIIHPVHLVKS
ncbi:50S ribosomal protein L21e [Candidatus Woesearchaeota archaeon]|nr:50S ribosomal protein L21e [Candidatus Woesearchaeota archaeon]